MSYYGGKNTEACTGKEYDQYILRLPNGETEYDLDHPFQGAETPGSRNAFVKSSALAPVSTNWMGMYLIKEHMNAHYRRICNVKAAVDTNRRHGNANSKFLQVKSAGASRVTSRASSRAGVYGKTSAPREAWNDEGGRGGFQYLDKIDRYLKSVQKEKPKIPEQSNLKPSRPNSSTSCASRKTSSRLGQKLKRRHPIPDLLEKHRDYFTKPEEPFMPRTLVRESQSRLVGSRVYQPPPRRSSSQESVVQSPRQHLSYERESRPAASQQVALAAGQKQRVVPALNIQRDSDHLRWIQLQARKVRAEQKLEELDYDVDDSDDQEFRDLSSPLGSCHCKHNRRKSYHRDHHEDRSYSDPRRRKQHPLSYHSSSWVKKQLEAEEEELKCLEFINDVTNDILIRGIYTDRALKQVFQYHIGRRNDLNQSKIKVMLDKLQEDLGIERSEMWKKQPDDFILRERYTAKPSSKSKFVPSRYYSNEWTNEASDLLDTPRPHTKEQIKETKDPTLILEKVTSLPDDDDTSLGGLIRSGRHSDQFEFADVSSRSHKSHANGHLSPENILHDLPSSSKREAFSRGRSVSSDVPKSARHSLSSRSKNSNRKEESGEDHPLDDEITKILAAASINGRDSDANRSDEERPDYHTYSEQGDDVGHSESNYEKYLEQNEEGFESSNSEGRNYDSNSAKLQTHSVSNGKNSSSHSSSNSVVDDDDDASVAGNMNSPSLRESYREDIAESVNSSESSYDS